jgi:hypothetical protein
MVRRDTRACSDLCKHLQHNDAVVRYHIIQAAGNLGCLSQEVLSDIARDDLDADIQRLAVRLGS